LAIFGNVELSEITSIERELLNQSRRLSIKDQKKIIAQVKAIADIQ